MRMTLGLRQNSAQHHVVGTEIKKRIEVSRIRGIRILSGRCETRTVKLDRMFHVTHIVRLRFFSRMNRCAHHTGCRQLFKVCARLNDANAAQRNLSYPKSAVDQVVERHAACHQVTLVSAQWKKNVSFSGSAIYVLVHLQLDQCDQQQDEEYYQTQR
jgi:hypothetical protein